MKHHHHDHPLRRLLDQRIVIIDGAMGTTIRTYGMSEAEIRGERFKDSRKDLLNNGDLFSLTQPKMICDIHRRFLEAGADIIETNTFGATSITQSEFFVDDPREQGGRKDPAFYQKVIEDPFLKGLAWEINEQSARQCRELADRVANADGRQRFVAGCIGPLTVSLSNSPDAEDAGFRVVTFDQVKAAYAEQVRALIAGGSDVLLVETIFDSLNAKAALVAIREVFDADRKDLPVMVSAAVGRGGETMISAQTVEALWNAVEHVHPISVGLNCSLGPDLMYPFLSELAQKATVADLLLSERGVAEPAVADRLRSGAARHGPLPPAVRRRGDRQHRRRLLRQHARAHRGDRARARRPAAATSARAPGGVAGRAGGSGGARTPAPAAPVGLAAVHAAAGRVHDDRRAHQRRRLTQVRQADQGREVRGGGRDRAAAGRERRQRHRHLHGRRDDRRRRRDDAGSCRCSASEPEVAKVPFMVDSSKWEVIEAGLRELQGKGIVNSISLKEGEDKFREHARTVRAFGAAVVVMAFDEQGQAATYAEKIRICERAYRILVDEVGFPPEDIIFDPNILTVATGIEEHNNYAVDFIEATRWIKANLPHAKVSGGVSNVSFSFRGNNRVREAMHACVPVSRHPRRAWTWGSSTPACWRSMKRSRPSCAS